MYEACWPKHNRVSPTFTDNCNALLVRKKVKGQWFPGIKMKIQHALIISRHKIIFGYAEKHLMCLSLAQLMRLSSVYQLLSILSVS